MKFLPLRDFTTVTSALNFTTADCSVTGSCDLYTTKAAGTDKKLYKTIDRSLESQQASLLTLGASLPPPQREKLSASLARSSPFGNLSDTSSRRIFAFLIATLNASHPDYDFSHVLRPTDFRREKHLRQVVAKIDSTIYNVRPRGGVSTPSSVFHHHAYASSPPSISSPTWGPQMWAMIDKEMKLADCTCFSYSPGDDPFDGEEAAIWRLHYFFFNKTLKRVAYFYVRGVPVVVNSPALSATRQGSNSGSQKRPFWALSSSSSAGSASKRARYWLGDRFADRVVDSVQDDDDDEYQDDDNYFDGSGVVWDPDEDVDIDPLNDPSSRENSEDEYLQSEDGSDEEEEEEEEERDQDDDDRALIEGPGSRVAPRGISEDIAARMDL